MGIVLCKLWGGYIVMPPTAIAGCAVAGKLYPRLNNFLTGG